ncbi:hypothetical protein EZV61_14355 [Corallincola luteus]|uniref:Uncharacterized protein n=1 Tax=Corallincola luteus TaxID=1775177 RepID=A0ABY2AMI7_9GAMM|nr:hypothetical protein [Corallincola luteus]TCI02531.1 hypothetical protein EZV61_14355 [Corallincola luteus]
MSDIVNVGFTVREYDRKTWLAISELLASGGSGSKFQDLLDEIQPAAGDLFDDFFEEFEPEEFFAEDYQVSNNQFLLALMGGPDGESLGKAIEDIFSKLPIDNLTISIGTDSADD